MIFSERYSEMIEHKNGIGFTDNVLMSLPYIRNNCAAHGVGAVENTIDYSLANLAVNMAAALDTYMVEEYLKDI